MRDSDAHCCDRWPHFYSCAEAARRALASSSAPAAVVPVVALKLLVSAERIVRQYASRNPRWSMWDNGETEPKVQDPCGAHGWLEQYAALSAAQAPQPAPAPEPAAPEPRIWWKTGEEGEFMMSPHLPGATERYLADGWRPTYDATSAQPVAAPSAPVQGEWQPLETAPAGVPLLVQFRAWNNPANELSEQVAWFYNGEWREYPQTGGIAYAERWRPLQHPPQPSAQEAPREAVSDEQTGIMRFARFGAELFKRHRNDGYPGDVDGGELQELAEKFGLIEQREVTEPCGEGCTCAEIGDFPSVCYFTTAEAKEARAILATVGREEQR